MNRKSNKVKLTEKDKKILSNNSNICTESHSKGCTAISNNEKDKNLN